jgi:hypothetical protein
VETVPGLVDLELVVAVGAVAEEARVQEPFDALGVREQRPEAPRRAGPGSCPSCSWHRSYRLARRRG